MNKLISLLHPVKSFIKHLRLYQLTGGKCLPVKSIYRSKCNLFKFILFLLAPHIIGSLLYLFRMPVKILPDSSSFIKLHIYILSAALARNQLRILTLSLHLSKRHALPLPHDILSCIITDIFNAFGRYHI